MRRVVVGSILGCWLLAATVGCGNGGPSGPPSTWKAPPVQGSQRKANANRNQGSVPMPNMPGVKQ